MKAIFIEKHGGAEVLQFGDFPKPAPAAGQVLVKVAWSGVNYIDTYHREGLYKLPLPCVLGVEGAGVVDSLGDGVTDFKPGDPVAWVMARGSYGEFAAVPAQSLLHIPAGLDPKQAAAALLQGMTAHYLTHSTFAIDKNHTALVHAAAGGTGRLITQMIKLRGGRVIATAGSKDKADVARAAGADEVILYRDQEIAAEVKRLTASKGVDVVYDGVGASVYQQNLDSLRPRGMFITFGNASGPVPPIDPLVLMQKGSLFATRPTLGNYIATPEELHWRAGDLLGWIQSGKITLLIEREYPLSSTAQAHQDLEGRKTTGKLVIKVS